jgi:hypothetical protein
MEQSSGVVLKMVIHMVRTLTYVVAGSWQYEEPFSLGYVA